METTSYPATCYQTLEIPNYSSIAERRRLSGPALRRFFKIMRKWKMDAKDMRLLLGGISNRRFKQLSSRPDGRILNQEELLRVTSVLAIDKSLHKLLPKSKADKWVRKPDRRLRGGTPLFLMIDGGPLALWEWRLRLERLVAEKHECEKQK